MVVEVESWGILALCFRYAMLLHWATSVAMSYWLGVVVAELLDEVGADEESGGEEDFDDDEYRGYHCSCFFSC